MPPWSSVRLRRPDGLVAGTRWLFALCALASLALSAPAPVASAVADGSGERLLLSLLAAVLLATCFVARYRGWLRHWVLDLVEPSALMLFAATCETPAVAFGFAFSSLWLRALYGSTRRILLYCAGVAAAMAAAVPVWSLLPGHVGAVDPAPVLGALPLLFLTMTVALHLARVLFAREQSQERDGALARLGTTLLGLTEPDAVYQQAWVAAGEICKATPGMRALVVAERDTDLEVMGHTDGFVDAPDRLPLAVLDPVEGQPQDVGPHPALDAAVGFAGHWVRIPLPQQPEGTMLLGAPGPVPVDGQVAIRSMMNQVALAVRTTVAHQELAALAHTDGLTGMANRMAFTSAVREHLACGGGGALLFVDLDDFKTVNDNQGHAAGDALLREAAQRISATVGDGHLCARLGGDEFAVLLREADVAGPLAQAVVDALARPVCLDGRGVSIGASVGVSVAGEGAVAEQLLQHADVAMYAAKGAGKGRVQVFHPGLVRSDEQRRFEAELGSAVEAGQLVVHYQPVLSAGVRRCTAVEALVRWQHPTRGLLGPLEFVDVAERTGAIIGIGAAVMRAACAFVADQRRVLPSPLGAHVNVSAAQLVDPGFVDLVRSCVQDFDLVDGQLVLEITESMVLDVPSVRATLDELVGVGVALAVDDFGTGYSALTTLRTLPLTIVKIDKSFVTGYPAHRADHAVVDAIVQMASRLGLTTVAEGVERIEQQQHLEAAGVDALQGYLYRRPAPAEEIGPWLREHAEQAAVLVATAPVLPRRRRG